MSTQDKQSLIGTHWRIYYDSIAKKGFMGIGRITEVDSFNASGKYAFCRVRLTSRLSRFPNIDAWIDVSENSPDKIPVAVII